MRRRFRHLPLLEEALRHRGVPLPKQALASFRDTFLLQLPWAIRSYREVEATLLQEDPDALAPYAEHSGLGRAAVAAACEHSIPSFAVQHGILYPRFYANEHSRDEIGPGLDGVDSVPIATRTAVYGNLARDLLVERGNYPAERIVVTGSPKFDALVAAGRHFSKEKTRKRLRPAPTAPGRGVGACRGASPSSLSFAGSSSIPSLAESWKASARDIWRSSLMGPTVLPQPASSPRSVRWVT